MLIRIFAFTSIVCYGIYNVSSKVKISSTFAIANDYSTTPPSNNNHHIHTIDNGPTTRSHNDTVRISFSLHDPHTVPFQNAFAPHGCDIGPIEYGTRSSEIPPSLLLGVRSGGGRVLDFTTTIDTNLNVLQFGDSVTIQIAEALDEMLGGLERRSSRQVVWEAWRNAVGGTRMAPTRGGGMHGSWRSTGLLSEAARGRSPFKNMRGGGWNYWQVQKFLGHVYEWEGRNVTVEKVDAVLFRVMHGWMGIHEITRERIVEAAELAHSILGASAVVFMTVPFTNNVRTVEDMEGVRKINEVIRDVAQNWHLEHDTQVLIMEYAAYCNHLIWRNARHMGYDVSAPSTSDPQIFDAEGPHFLLERLKKQFWPPSVPMVCNKMPTNESRGEYCEQNFLFKDGMHICTETLAARVGAGLACLLGCVYNRKELQDEGSRREKIDARSELETRASKIRACERQCNEQFLSVTPVKNSWVVDPNITLASFSGI